MKGYLSIGKVAKLKNVSIKSLRYYDEIGIFKPAHVDKVTNYRYYKEEQLFLLDAISLCIELGIPLKDLNKYHTKDGDWDFRSLLFDGKTMAESRIRSMRESLEKLQTTLDQIEKGEISTVSNIHEDKNDLPIGCVEKTIERRFILTIPFDIATSFDRYNHKLLELFVGADQLGLHAAYPAGVCYTFQDNSLQKNIFISLEDQHPVISNASKFEVKLLPTANYLCHSSTTHGIERAASIFHPIFKAKKPYLLLEHSITDSATKETSFELQYLPLD